MKSSFEFASLFRSTEDMSYPTVAFQCSLAPKGVDLNAADVDRVFAAIDLMFDLEGQSIVDPVCVRELNGALGFEVRPVTPVILTNSVSPIEVLIRQIGHPRGFVDGWPLQRCVLSVWSDFDSPASIVDDKPCSIILSSALSLIARAACHEGSDLLMIATPGWDYDGEVKSGLSVEAREALKASGMLIVERTLSPE